MKRESFGKNVNNKWIATLKSNFWTFTSSALLESIFALPFYYRYFTSSTISVMLYLSTRIYFCVIKIVSKTTPGPFNFTLHRYLILYYELDEHFKNTYRYAAIIFLFYDLTRFCGNDSNHCLKWHDYVETPSPNKNEIELIEWSIRQLELHILH